MEEVLSKHGEVEGEINDRVVNRICVIGALVKVINRSIKGSICWGVYCKGYEREQCAHEGKEKA